MSSLSFARVLGLVAVLSGLLAGCISMSPSTIWKLRKLDPLESDPGAMRFAVMMPDILRVRDGDAKALIHYETADQLIEVDEIFYLVVTNDGADSAAIARDIKPGMTVSVLELRDSDAVRMRRAQKDIRTYKKSGLQGSGRLTFATGACRKADVRGRALKISVYLQTSPDSDFFPLFRNQDIRQITPEADQFVSGLQECKQT